MSDDKIPSRIIFLVKKKMSSRIIYLVSDEIPYR